MILSIRLARLIMLMRAPIAEINVAGLRMRSMTMVRASQHFPPTAPAQVSRHPAEYLGSEQCENAQQGEDIRFVGRTKHVF